jgi:putative component of membrane protein insertase Oxa1/YidC/SpoIIIJ protein YidD
MAQKNLQNSTMNAFMKTKHLLSCSSMNFILCLVCLTLSSHFAYAKPGYEDPWGKGASLAEVSGASNEPKPMQTISGKFFEKLILFHQDVISPIDGPRSHFRPTSSRYMLLSMRRYGVIQGFIMGCDRLMRENGEKWVYRTITIDGENYKYDPTVK